MSRKIQNIIDHYRKWRIENPDTWIKFTAVQKNCADAICVAALSLNHLGKKNNHQKRLKNVNLESFKNNLLKRQTDIAHATDFHNLLKIVEECKVKGIADVACYDIANRLGNRLGKNPDYVYLHAGTRKGLENLLDYKVKAKYIKKSDLPEPFKSSTLTCHEIEDILCIYKDRLKKAHNKT